MLIVRRTLLMGAAALPIAAHGSPRLQEPARPLPVGTGCPADRDWAGLDHYSESNRAILAAKAPVNVVFLGDGLTASWMSCRPDFFRAGRVARGIAGQQTGQMLLRMMADVVALKPRFLHLLGGAQDLVSDPSPAGIERIVDNLRMMTQIAWANHMTVMIGAVPPARGFPSRPDVDAAGAIRALNEALRAQALRTGAAWIDYWNALADADGGIRREFAGEGVEPNEAGYDAMIAAIEPALRARRL